MEFGQCAHLSMLDEIEAQARALSLRLDPVGVRTADDVDGAFVALVEKRPDALFVLLDPVTLSRRDQIVALAAKSRLPTMFEVRQFVDVGGLMSYGVDYRAHYHRAALYVNKILKGAKPEDLPVE
jgi:putative tryptophan/tyrosine transport system substrate-binding protein